MRIVESWGNRSPDSKETCTTCGRGPQTQIRFVFEFPCGCKQVDGNFDVEHLDGKCPNLPSAEAANAELARGALSDLHGAPPLIQECGRAIAAWLAGVEAYTAWEKEQRECLTE